MDQWSDTGMRRLAKLILKFYLGNFEAIQREAWAGGTKNEIPPKRPGEILLCYRSEAERLT